MKLWKILLATMIALVLVCAVAMADEDVCPKTADGKHVLGTWTMISDVDCVNDGVSVIYKCTKEGCPSYKKVLQYDVWAEATGHDWRVYTNGKNEAATCTSEGIATYYCVNCWNNGDGLNTKTETLKKLDHTPVKSNQLSKAATCTEGGYDYFKCDVCKTDWTKDTKATGHNWTEVVGQPANCKDEGYTSHKQCTVCFVTEGKTIIPARSEHNAPALITENTVPATCYTDGVEYWHCAKCDANWTKTVKATGNHVLTPKDGKDATCTEDGYTAYQACTTKGCTYFVNKVIIPASGTAHTWKYNGKVEATCEKGGYEMNKCTVCGEYQLFNKVDALDHKFDYVLESKNASCTEKGYEKRICSVCSTTKNFDIAKLAHTYVESGAKGWQTVVAPKCEAEGRAERYCTVCGREPQLKAVPALGHVMGSPEWVKAPDCVNDGEGISSCLNGCGKTEKQTIKALGHATYDEVVAAATCTQQGMKHIWCSRTGCKTPLVERNVLIPATNHKGAKITVTKEATCTAEGERVVECPTCGKKTEKIAKLAHKYEWVTTPATPSANGKSEYKCACGDIAETKTIKYTKWYYNNTMTSFGPTTKELVGGNDWYRVTPVDLAVDGVYTYDLIASNKYVVGTATITVNAGSLTVSYKTNYSVDVKDEALLIYASKADLATGTAVTAPVGAAINAAETFGADTKVLVSLILTGDYDAAGKGLVDASAAAGMIANID